MAAAILCRRLGDPSLTGTGRKEGKYGKVVTSSDGV